MKSTFCSAAQPRKSRRRATQLAATLALLGAVSTSWAADLSQIRLLVGFPAGAGTDTLARLYGEALGAELGSTVVVENRPGAGGQIAARQLKDAAPDGRTLMMAIDHQIVMLRHIMRNPGFDALNDFVPIVRLSTYSICMAVSANVPATTLDEWAKLVRDNTITNSVGVPAVGSNAHFMGHILSEHYKVPVNVIPYKGAAPLLTDAMGGHVDALIQPCGDPLLRADEAGKVRIIGVAAPERLASRPTIATFQEAGIDAPQDYFLGVYAPAGTPPATLEQLRSASMAALSRPGVVEKLATTGLDPAIAPADELDRVARRSIEAWGERIRSSGFEPQ